MSTEVPLNWPSPCMTVREEARISSALSSPAGRAFSSVTGGAAGAVSTERQAKLIRSSVSARSSGALTRIWTKSPMTDHLLKQVKNHLILHLSLIHI